VGVKGIRNEEKRRFRKKKEMENRWEEEKCDFVRGEKQGWCRGERT